MFQFRIWATVVFFALLSGCSSNQFTTITPTNEIYANTRTCLNFINGFLDGYIKGRGQTPESLKEIYLSDELSIEQKNCFSRDDINYEQISKHVYRFKWLGKDKKLSTNDDLIYYPNVEDAYISNGKNAIFSKSNEPKKFYTFYQPRTKAIHFTGYIKPKSVRAVKKLLKNNPEAKKIHLWSPGGEVNSGKTLGKIIKSANLDTYVIHYCHSSCLFAMTHGKNRLISDTSKLGFHQIAYSDDTSGYGDIGGFGYHKLRANEYSLKATYVKLGVDKDFIERMYNTPHKSLTIPEPNELLENRVVDRVDDEIALIKAIY